MTLATETAVWNHLNTYAPLTALLGTFQGSPAVFLGNVPEQPDDVAPEFESYVFIDSPYSMEDESTKTSPDRNSAWESIKVVACVPRKFSMVEVHLLEEQILERLNRSVIAPFSNYAFRDVWCLPGVGLDDDYYLRRVLDLTVYAEQTAL